MLSIRLKVFPGSYNNCDVYEKVLTYISLKSCHGGYGFFPYDIDSIIRDFQLSEKYSVQKSDQKMWHFIISFSEKLPDVFALMLADKTAKIFYKEYQVYYGLDKETSHLHIHFAVNAYSYHPEKVILNRDAMFNYSKIILNEFKNVFPETQTILSFQKEGKSCLNH